MNPELLPSISVTILGKELINYLVQLWTLCLIVQLFIYCLIFAWTKNLSSLKPMNWIIACIPCGCQSRYMTNLREIDIAAAITTRITNFMSQNRTTRLFTKVNQEVLVERQTPLLCVNIHTQKDATIPCVKQINHQKVHIGYFKWNKSSGILDIVSDQMVETC